MTTTYTFEQLKEDVRKEAEALKVHATKEELSRLEIEEFNAGLYDACIYGLMTGNCASERGNELIGKCCVRFIDNEVFIPGDTNTILAMDMPDLNGIKSNRVFTGSGVRLKYLSAIETYIMCYEARNANLIAFLRGETETLTL